MRLHEKYEDAILVFNHAIDLQSNDPWAYAHRGETYCNWGKYENAIADFEHALALDDKNDWALAGKGETYRIIGDYPKALIDRSSARGGVWRLFHNPKDTFTDVPKYDAMPSGHLASSMLTLTVIADNYPEYKFIRPLGYSLMSVLAFQMMNNGVHWMSDYPMGLFIGYDVAKHVTQKGRTIHVLSAPGTSRKQSFFERMDIAPAQFENDGYGVRSSFTF